MITKEMLHSEIDKVGDEYVEELYGVIKNFMSSHENGKKLSFMAKLKSIKSNAPADVAANHDLHAMEYQKPLANERA